MFNELLSELTPGEEHPEDRRLLHDVSGTCREMQVLLLENKQINKKKKTDIVFVICWRGALGSILLQQYTFHHSSVSRSQFLRTLLNLMIDWCTEWWLMQARILELIGLVQHRELTASLLDLNDQMNNQLLRFLNQLTSSEYSKTLQVWALQEQHVRWERSCEVARVERWGFLSRRGGDRVQIPADWIRTICWMRTRFWMRSICWMRTRCWMITMLDEDNL